MKQTANILVIAHGKNGPKEIQPGASLDGVSSTDLEDLQRMGALTEPDAASQATKGAARNSGTAGPESAASSAKP